ncbi:MAG: pyridoxal-phosphate dependent enzyme [Beijerinckiaceae bacterium]|nr:pyridoxal-phosphate dependent enzyme [Beijerinckiaceae bacterium]
MIYPHPADVMGSPSLIRLTDELFVLRFEVMKIKSAMAAVEALLDKGVIHADTVLTDSSSGVYALALALTCHKHRLGCHLITSRTVDPSLKLQLELLGARTEVVQSAGSLKVDQEMRVRRVMELVAADKRYYWMQQYHDKLHYLGYSEIATQLESEFKCDELHLVGGVGSGASTGGLAHFLRPRYKKLRVIGVQPFQSITFGSSHLLDPDNMIAGIGSGIAFLNVDYSVYDDIHWTAFSVGLSGAVELLKLHGVFAGLSSGCCYAVSRWESTQTGRPTIMIAADTGHRYVDKVFSRHHEAQTLSDLEPTLVSDLNQIQPPWSKFFWNGRNYDPIAGG